jgi:hypothetical protein
MSAVSVESVSRTVEALLIRDGRAITFHDRGAGVDRSVTPATAAAANGLLPILVVAGEAIWHEATGRGFELDIVRDKSALLGYRLRGIGSGSFTTVMLSTMTATDQIARPTALPVDRLHLVWSAAIERFDQRARPAAQAGPRARAMP